VVCATFLILGNIGDVSRAPMWRLPLPWLSLKEALDCSITQ